MGRAAGKRLPLRRVAMDWLRIGGLLSLLACGLTVPARAQLQGPVGNDLVRLEIAGRAHPEEVAAQLEQRLAGQSGKQASDIGALLTWLRLLGSLRVTLEQPDAVQTVVERLEQIALTAPARLRAQANATALCIRADQLLTTGPVARAEALLADALPLLDAESSLSLRFYCLGRQAAVKESLGRFDEAVRTSLELVRLADQVAPWRRSSSRSSLANTYFRAGQGERALQINEEAKKIAEADKDWLGLADAMTVEGILLTRAERAQTPGQESGELRALRLAIEYARMAGAVRDEALGLGNLSDYYLHQADFKRAYELAQQALPLAREVHYSLAETLALQNSGLALIAMHRKEEGLALVREEMERMRRADLVVDLAEAAEELGHYLEQAGYHAEALEAYQQERELAREVYRHDQQKAILELQESFDAERRRHERDMLNDDNQLKAETLRHSDLRFRQWALAGAVGLMALLLMLLGYVRIRSTHLALRKNNERLKVQSEQDPLTGLANRRHFQVLTGRPELGAEARGALYLLDLDHFKRVNDCHGHAAGDAVLVEVARRLRAVVREQDLVVRWGGEEFLILVPNARTEQVDVLAQRLLAALASVPVVVGGVHIDITGSIGFAEFPLQPEQLELGWPMAIDLVDSAMYLAKTQGRNRACGVRRIPASNRVELERLMLDLEAAWRDGLIRLAEYHGPQAAEVAP